MPGSDSKRLIISPHLDDAVFSCGAAVAAAPGAIVCTVFAGTPPSALVTDWDTKCGFKNAHQAMRARRDEDASALAMLGASPTHLPFLDSQYAGDAGATAEAIASALVDVIRHVDCRTLLIPFGLFHSDHALVHEAARCAWLRDLSIACIAYEDCLYRRMNALLQGRLADLARHGIAASPISKPVDTTAYDRAFDIKRRAIHRYASQLRAFGLDGYDDVFAPERFWTLAASNDERQ